LIIWFEEKDLNWRKLGWHIQPYTYWAYMGHCCDSWINWL